MKIQDIIHLLENQQLNEINMSPSSLRAFAASPAAKSMRAGFEAELIFTGWNEAAGDYDFSDNTIPTSIEEAVDFFESSPQGLSRRQAWELRDQLESDYRDWVNTEIQERWDHDIRNKGRQFITSYVEDVFDEDEVYNEIASEYDDPDEYSAEISERVTREFERMVSDIAAQRSDHYERAFELFTDEETDSGGLSEYSWFDEADLDLRTIAENNDIEWPYYDVGSSAFSLVDAQVLAEDFQETFGFPIKVTDRYHGVERDETTWIFEPDSSITPDNFNDLAVEIVSPPMPLDECIQLLPKFFKWATSKGAYSNDSTGFHMSASVVGQNTKQDLDFVKLVLLLGDQHVLRQFDRTVNNFTTSALTRLHSVAQSTANVANAYNLIRAGLGKMASEALATSDGFGKHFSVNPKEKYVEFRSAGNQGYIQDADAITTTLMRYARALSAALDPAADKQEYLKRLYTLLSSSIGNQPDTLPGSVELFSQYAAGAISQQQLLAQLQQRQINRVTTGNSNGNSNSNSYEIVERKTDQVLDTIQAPSVAQAIQLMKRRAFDNGWDISSVKLKPVGRKLTDPVLADDPDTAKYRITNARGTDVAGIDAPNAKIAMEMFDSWLITHLPSSLNATAYKLTVKDS